MKRREEVLHKYAILYFILNIFSASSIPVAQFYPFGASTRDQKLAKNDDGSSGKLKISTPFPFFDKFHDSLFVNTNGVVSFLKAVSQYTPNAFPLGNNRRLLTAFWGDVDTRKGGEVWYRETTDQQILDRATSDVRGAFIKQKQFVVTWAYIVTWDRVAFYGSSGVNRNRTNSFQSILISNGRHSFVVYNYGVIVWTTGTASGGNSTGLGGTPAQCGFNAGDKVRFFTIPGSRTNAVLKLTQTSNVGKPGVWMFRIDNANIEAGGCNVKGSLTVSPSFASMLGGDNILVAGPCFKPNDTIICEFNGNKRTKGAYINEIRAICTVPMATRTGRVPLLVSRDNGTSFLFHGIFSYVPVTRVNPLVTRVSPDTWMEGVDVDIRWDSEAIGNSSELISIQLSRYVKNNDVVSFHSHYVINESRLNDGFCRFSVPVGMGEGSAVGDGRFVTFVRVIRKQVYTSQSQYNAEWIWSDLFVLLNFERAPKRCKYFAKSEPNPNTFTDDTTFLACPRNLVQAMADRGRYTEDEICNTHNEDGCALYHRGANVCFRTITPSDKGAGQQCCYNNHGNLMLKLGSAGSLDRVHVDTGIPYISHFFHDLVPYLDCCFLSRDESCRLYYTKRPSDNGQFYEAPRPATGFGDPHMVTLDRVEYTFNGYGEYTIINVLSSNFTLQGRMEPLTVNGVILTGTVCTAFAAKETGSDAVQFELNGRGMVDVLVNKENVELEQEGITEFQNMKLLKYTNVSKYSAIFRSGISVTIKGTPDLLQMILLVPQSFKGNTSGLLGFWDDNKEKEFLLPDGSYIETNSSSRQIHNNFALKWATLANESLFQYQQGKNHSTYARPQYQPTFIDRESLGFNNKTLEQEARAACGGSIQCLFDIKVTKNINIGVASRQSFEEFSAIIKDTSKKGCIPIYPNVVNGIVHRNDTDDGSINYRITCNEGYFVQGLGYLSCTDGVWNGTLANCTPSACKPRQFDVPGGTTQKKELEDGGITYIVTCKKGYILHGSGSLSCHHGIWNGTLPKCSRGACKPRQFDVPGGTTQKKELEDGGITYIVTCKKGYILHGSGFLSCHHGIWNSTLPKCTQEAESLLDKLKEPLIGVACGIVVVVIVIIVYVTWKQKKRPEPNHEHAQDLQDFSNVAYLSNART